MDESVLLIAEAMAQSEIDAGIDRARKGLAKQPPNYDGLCTECGDELPEVRITFGAVTCISCQIALERAQALIWKTRR